MKRDNVHAAAILVGALLVWEALGRLTPLGREVIASPTMILAQYWTDADLYVPHVLATVRSASLGFFFGSLAAVSAAVVFCRFPLLESLWQGANIALFAMPAIVVGPVLVLVFSGNLPQIILAALVVYFPTMAAALVGLRDVDPRLVDLIEVHGGDQNTVLRFVRLRASLPAMLAGLRAGATLAVLGAILGEFGSGVRWGLGSFLLGSLGDANPARLLGIGFAATAIALAGYELFVLVGKASLGATLPVTIGAGRSPDEIAAQGRLPLWVSILVAAAAAALPFVIWALILRVTQISPIIAPGPIETLSYPLVGPQAADVRAALGHALGETLPLAGLGLVCGLAVAFAIAALSELRPALARAILPGAMLLQSTPLIALVPLVLLLFGRDAAASTVTAILVVFFPAYVLLAQGFELTPKPARELVEAYGGGRLKEFLLVSTPYAASYLFAAAKLVAPRALLGVMVAEWLLSGKGLGNLINQSRGMLDYDMVWLGAVVSILISVAAYEAVALIERRMRTT